MAKRVKFDLELPDELFAQFHEKEIEAKAREALVMELLREHPRERRQKRWALIAMSFWI